jgi:hypothetical protein
MPPVECTSLASGAEAPHLYWGISPLTEEYPYMEYHQPLLSRQEIFLSSAALPDTPNPLVSTFNYFVFKILIFGF